MDKHQRTPGGRPHSLPPPHRPGPPGRRVTPETRTLAGSCRGSPKDPLDHNVDSLSRGCLPRTQGLGWNPAGRRPPALTRLPPHPRDPATTRRNLTGAGARATRVKFTSQTQNRTPLADRIHGVQLLVNAPCPTRRPPHTRDLDSGPLQLGRRRRTCRPAQAQGSQPRLGARIPTDRPIPLPRPPLGFPSSRARHQPPGRIRARPKQ